MTVDLYRAIERRNFWCSLAWSTIRAGLYLGYTAGIVYSLINWPE